MKVLLISHNPMNMEDNNGRTLATLFGGFEKGAVAQLYLHSGLTHTDFCDRYFCITDFDVLRSITRLKKPGRVVENGEVRPQQVSENAVYDRYSKKTPLVQLARDLVWGLGTWKTKELKDWLTDFGPDVIFFYASDCVFSQKLARWVKQFLDVPMAIYWVDDFYLKFQGTRNPFSAITQAQLKRIETDNIRHAENACIVPAMADAYQKVFGVPFSTIYNTSANATYGPKCHTKPLQLSYLGNISLGRYRSLVTIGRIISERGLPMELHVYSAERRKDLLDGISNRAGVHFHGAVDYAAVQRIMEQSDALLHVEDFSPDHVDACRFSLSTKIADSLHSNRCLLCYGPAEVASMDYLKRENCALMAHDEEGLAALLERICAEPSLLDDTAGRALAVAEKNHTPAGNHRAVSALLERAMSRETGV